jgi:hypothetical protein
VKTYSHEEANKHRALFCGDQVRAILVRGQRNDIEIIQWTGTQWAVVKSYDSMSNNYAYSQAGEYAERLAKQLDRRPTLPAPPTDAKIAPWPRTSTT